MSSISVAGDTSGSVTLSAPAVAGSTVLTLPSVSGTLVSTGNAVSFSSVTTPIVNSATTLQLQTNGTTTAVTIDASQNVGIGGTNNANPKLQIWQSSNPYGLEVMAATGGANNGIANIRLLNATNTVERLQISGISDTLSYIQAQSSLAFNTGGGTERMRIDSSGNVLVGQTTGSFSQAGIALVTGYSRPNSYGISIAHPSATAASGDVYVGFVYNALQIASITQNGTTGVLYNLTSDYRLKNNATPLTDASKFIMALQPKTWDWWDGSGKGVGFIAHEFMEVAKYSGNGKKDEIEIVDDFDIDGKKIGTKEVPKYQSIQPSSSEVMANIVSMLQEQQALITTLQTQITALNAKVGI